MALVRELRELQNFRKYPSSNWELTPERHEEMRADIRKFYRSEPIFQFQLDDADCVRWLALRDGAEMAIKQNAVLWRGQTKSPLALSRRRHSRAIPRQPGLGLNRRDVTFRQLEPQS